MSKLAKGALLGAAASTLVLALACGGLERKTKKALGGGGGGKHEPAAGRPLAPGPEPNASIRTQRASKMVQFGSAGDENGEAIVVHSSGVYVAGATTGQLGRAAAGENDAFIRKYGPNMGRVLWEDQFGTSSTDEARAVVADDSGVYACGLTEGSLDGPSQGMADIWVRKYDHDGRILWKEQFGSGKFDEALAMSIGPDGSLYLTGGTVGRLGADKQGDEDNILRKYTPDGKVAWTQQWGGEKFEEGCAVVASRHGIYVVGATGNKLGKKYFGNEDAFLTRFEPDGRLDFTVQLGSPATEFGRALAVDDTGVYVGGRTTGQVGGKAYGGDDPWVAKVALDGSKLLWVRQWGTDTADVASAFEASDGGLWVVGSGGGVKKHVEAKDTQWAWVRKLDRDGNDQWEARVDSAKNDDFGAVTVHDGTVYAIGTTSGKLGESTSGQKDAVVATFPL